MEEERKVSQAESGYHAHKFQKSLLEKVSNLSLNEVILSRKIFRTNWRWKESQGLFSRVKKSGALLFEIFEFLKCETSCSIIYGGADFLISKHLLFTVNSVNIYWKNEQGMNNLTFSMLIHGMPKNYLLECIKYASLLRSEVRMNSSWAVGLRLQSKVTLFAPWYQSSQAYILTIYLKGKSEGLFVDPPGVSITVVFICSKFRFNDALNLKKEKKVSVVGWKNM